ncbi:MAG: tetratricopeptide repeat protein [Opitutae bacterium]|nr:tetratricopeptide repeat protein [Opitutae bacterium]
MRAPLAQTFLFRSQIWTFILLFLICVPLQGQNGKQMVESMTLESLTEAIRGKETASVLPLIRELVRRIEAEPVEQLETALGQCYYLLARFHYNQYVESRQEQNRQQCIDFGNRLRKRLPSNLFCPETLNFEIQILLSEKQWEALKPVLREGLNGIREGQYSVNYRNRWLKNLCLVHAILKEWKIGEPRFRQLYDVTLIDDKSRIESAIYLIRSYEAQKQADKMLEFIPMLSGAGEDRFDPELNLSLFKLGNQFSDNSDFIKANYLYFLCLTLEDIIAFNERKLAEFESRRKWYVLQKIDLPEELSYEIQRSTKYIADLKKQKSYTAPLKYNRARNLDRMERRYDAFFAYLRLVREHPEDDNTELFEYSAFNKATDVGYVEEVLELGESYLATPSFRIYRTAVFAKLISTYFQLENYEKVHFHGRQFMREYPEHSYATSVVHFMGFAWTRMEAFETLESELGAYVDAYPAAPMGQSAHYWMGITQVVKQEFESARKHFQIVVDNFSGGGFYTDARFRLGVCDFGAGNYAAAKEQFNSWVKDYPENHLRGEAEVFLGDIAAINAKVPESLAHYASVETFTSKMNLIDHAYFESSRLLEANDRLDEIITLLERYSEKFSEEGNLSRAIYRIGEVHEILGEPARMLESYFSAIQSYGNQAEAEGVDPILLRYVNKYDSYRQRYEATVIFLLKILEDQDFRLQMVEDRKSLHLHRLAHPNISKDIVDLLLRDQVLREGLGSREIPQTDEEIEAGVPIRYDRSILPEARSILKAKANEVKGLLERFPTNPPRERFTELYWSAKEQQQRTLLLRLLVAFDALGIPAPETVEITVNDLPDASPATLAWIATEKLDYEPELARLAVNEVLGKHPFSLAVPEALRVQAELLLQDGDRSGAVALFRKIIEENPVWPKSPLMALRIGKLFMEANDYDQALDQYQSILQIRDWRGTAWAQACFMIGQCFEARNETLKAHGYYERTYLSYRQFPEWAGQALYADGMLLESMQELESARSVYLEFMALPNAETLSNYNEVKRRYNALNV